MPSEYAQPGPNPLPLPDAASVVDATRRRDAPTTDAASGKPQGTFTLNSESTSNPRILRAVIVKLTAPKTGKSLPLDEEYFYRVDR